MPKSTQLCSTYMSTSSKLPGSSSTDKRSRAVSRPLACCAAMRLGPPPCRAASRRASSSSIVVAMHASPVDAFPFGRRDARGQHRGRWTVSRRSGFDTSENRREMMRQPWPKRLWLVRHGQSQGNVARDAAHEAGLHTIDIDLRDVDVPLVRPRPRPGRSRRPLVRRASRETSGPRSSCPRPTSARARPPRRSAPPAGWPAANPSRSSTSACASASSACSTA